MLTFGSLFTGIGGIDLGFEQAGMKCAWQCEKNRQARHVLATHWPDVPCYEDVFDVTNNNVPSVDVICGGFPCQDVSFAGKRAGLAGERSGLWFEFHRIIEEFAPQWVVVENVPGLLSSNRGADFYTVVRGMVECGYGVSWRVLDAQYFGVAQRRRRVFIVGSLGNGRSAEILFEREGMFGHPPARRTQGEGVTYDVAPSLTASGSGTASAGNRSGQDPVIAQVLAGSAAFGGGNTKGEIDIATTLNASSQRYDFESETLVQSMLGVRRLTPVECERLQGFPDGWTSGQSDSTRYRQLGNAVAVPVARWIGARIDGSAALTSYCIPNTQFT